MNTEELLLKLWMGQTLSQDYVDWAVQNLSEGVDSPSLRILAGEDPNNWQDVARYFRKTCDELHVRPLREDAEPRTAARLVRTLYESETLTPEETLHLMSDLYERSDFSDPLLSIWFGVQDEFFPEPLGFLREWIDDEWLMLDLAEGLKVPHDFRYLCRCENCRDTSPRPKAAYYRDFRVMVDLAPVAKVEAVVCKKCGDSRLKHMGFSEVQRDYFERLREG